MAGILDLTGHKEWVQLKLRDNMVKSYINLTRESVKSRTHIRTKSKS